MTEVPATPSNVRACRACALRQTCKAPVPGQGSLSAPILLVGEAPGEWEDVRGRPFAGNSGKELDNYLRRAGLHRSACYVTNAVKCRPPLNRTPRPHEAAVCREHLAREVAAWSGSVVAALGAVACEAFLGPSDLDKLHGIPQRATFDCAPFGPVRELVVVPMYHPAYGMRATSKMGVIAADYRALKAVRAGRLAPEDHADPIPAVDYRLVEGADGALVPWAGEAWAFVDTETAADGSPWSFQVSYRPGWARMGMAADEDAVALFGAVLADPAVTTVLHNAKFDLRVLGEMGIQPARWADSMVAAYLLQDQPQGLKPAAYRLAALEMRSYRQVTAAATNAKLGDLFGLFACLEWPDPEPVEEWSPEPKKRWLHRTELVPCTARKKDAIRCPVGCEPRKAADPDACPICQGRGWYWEKVTRAGREVVPGTEKGHWKLRQPQNLGRLLRRLVDDLADPDKDADPWDRWTKYDKPQRDMVEEFWGEPIRPADLSEVEPAAAIEYACRDADATARCWPVLWSEVQARGMAPLHDLDMAIAPLILRMERVGMLLDLEALADLSAYYKGEMDRLEVEINQALGRELNPGSNKQLAEYLYLELGLEPPKTTPSGEPSVDEEALKLLRHAAPLVDKVLAWRGYSKNRGTYAEALPRRAGKDGRVRADILTTRTVTGRLAVKEPNLQNIPTRSEEGKRIRACFVAGPGRRLCSGDYAQIEMRVAASAGEDAELLDIFNSGQDFHSMTASKMFGVPLEQVDKLKHRYPAKRIGFGILYQMSALSLSEDMALEGHPEWTEPKCEKLIRDWFNTFHGVRRYFDARKAEARRHQRVTDIFGRQYPIPETRSAIKRIVAAGLRQACSYPIQGAAQTVMKFGMKALVPVYEKWRGRGYYCEPLIQIHDDLVSEVSEDIVDEFKADFKEAMEGAVDLPCPLESDTSDAERWSEL